MKIKLLLTGLIMIVSLAILSYILCLKNANHNSQPQSKSVKKPTIYSQAITKSPQNIKLRNSIFVPYWEIETNMDLSSYDKVYYFGIKPVGDTIDKNEQGYQNIARFISSEKNNQELILVVRIGENERYIFSELSDGAQNTLIQQIIDTASANNFKGIAFDTELSIIMSETLNNKINAFMKVCYTKARANNLSLSLIVYGDMFYRRRGYDIEYLAKNADEIMLMAYDFHKAGGEPGPNFPLKGKNNYGYDFTQMVNDFQSLIPSEKLTVIFGMYGYDWTVDEKKLPTKSAKSLTLSEIKQSFLQKCEWKDCVIRRDLASGETEINYVKSELRENEYVLTYHIVWFEDETSVGKKTEYLKKKGIYSIAHWAYGYY